MDQKNSFVFYRSYLTAAARMSDEQRLKFFDSLISYGLDRVPIVETGDSILDIAFDFAVPLLDANYRKYENGKKGGAPKGNQNAKKKNNQKQPKNNQKQGNVNVKDNGNGNVNANYLITPSAFTAEDNKDVVCENGEEQILDLWGDD